jgi:hypothetical protein
MQITSLRQRGYSICKDLSLTSDQLVKKNKIELLNFHDQEPRPHKYLQHHWNLVYLERLISQHTRKKYPQVVTVTVCVWIILGCEVNIPECIRVRGYAAKKHAADE